MGPGVWVLLSIIYLLYGASARNLTLFYSKVKVAALLTLRGVGYPWRGWFSWKNTNLNPFTFDGFRGVAVLEKLINWIKSFFLPIEVEKETCPDCDGVGFVEVLETSYRFSALSELKNPERYRKEKTYFENCERCEGRKWLKA